METNDIECTIDIHEIILTKLPFYVKNFLRIVNNESIAFAGIFKLSAVDADCQIEIGVEDGRNIYHPIYHHFPSSSRYYLNVKIIVEIDEKLVIKYLDKVGKVRLYGWTRMMISNI
jgi:hypothetical protein